MENKLKHPDYNSAADLKQILDSHGFSMQKKFGQNFLINNDARVKLIDNLDINENSTVWEVGPGLGAMTDEILRRGAKLTSFEIDKGFAKLVQDFFSDYSDKGKFNLVEGDVLKTWKKYKDENFFCKRLRYNKINVYFCSPKNFNHLTKKKNQL